MRIEWSWPAIVAGVLLGAALLALAYPVLRWRRSARRTQRQDGARAELIEPVLERSDASNAELQGRLDALANALQEVVLYVDAALVCRTHNEVAERLLGRAPDEIDGVGLREVLGESAYQEIEPPLARVFHGEPVRLRQALCNERGEVLQFDARFVPHVDPAGRIVGFHALLAPVSAEAPLERPAQALDRAASGRETAENETAESSEPEEVFRSESVVPRAVEASPLGESDEAADAIVRSTDEQRAEADPSLQTDKVARGEDLAPIPEGSAVGARTAGKSTPEDDLAQIEARRALFLEALQSGQFRLFEQSIVPVSWNSPQPTRHEILIRLRSEKTRLLHPAAFLDVGSEGGFLRDLDRWVVTRLLRWYAKHRDSFDPGARIGFHVNLSADTIRDESFPAFLRAVTQSREVEPAALCFELAEADVIAHRPEAITCAYALRMLGCRVAVDRFGVASQSFSALVGMPADFVKIDGAIIGRILVDPFSRTKTRAIAKVTQSMGARTIAGRVEDAETLELLRTLGIDYAQGFGIATPEPIERLAGRLERSLRANAPA